MGLVVNMFLCLALCLVTLVAATMELHNAMYKAIDENCSGIGKLKTCNSGTTPGVIHTKAVLAGRTTVENDGNRKVDGGVVVDASIKVHVQGKWSSDKTRNIMVNAAAKALDQITYSDKDNCYTVSGKGKYCNIADMVRLNMEPVNDIANYLWVEVSGGGPNQFDFQCCRTKDKVSDKLGGLSGPFKDAYGKKLTKEVRCRIYGLQTCEQCGIKHDMHIP
ncbi:hypothetical protein BKA63DRAFT_486965 [Paraphoma chrysanthemicola]|nr:hypothetical protein BKA63DRAFT_486965 [Paraphoma chrysanthemicola]